MKKIIVGMSIATSLFLAGCGTEVNISDYPNKIRQPVLVPDVCRNEYNSLKDIPKVAVMTFTNNSSFSKANVTNINANANSTNSSLSAEAESKRSASIKASSTDINYAHAGVAGVVADENAAVAVGASRGRITSNSASAKLSASERRKIKARISHSHSNANVNTTSRVVDPKLDKAISSALEGSLANMGGVKIYSRSDLNKVIKEQKLEQNGLFDEKTLVKLGKLAGVKYIITGSIDSVTQEYKDYESAANMAGNAVANGKKQKNLTNQLLGAAIKLSGSMASGMKITTRATIKIINVTTGEIVFSKSAEETKNIGKIKNPTYSQIIGAIKDDLMEEIKDFKTDLSKFFAPSGYIVQVKTNSKHDEFIAQINLGSKDGIKPEQTFSVYQFDEIIDPVTGKKSCDKYTMNVKLKVSQNQIEPKYAWTKAEGDDAPKIRAGQIIKRDGLKNGLF